MNDTRLERNGPPVPIVVVLYHREDETRRMFKQLERVTENYSLIVVDNGFDDRDFVRRLQPLHYVENVENTGAIRGINQGLELAEGKYVAILHNDILIYDKGWLDHIIEFMERRPDVGLVGLAGRHTILCDGNYDNETLLYNNFSLYPECFRPTWIFSEVATIDGLGWVMRNIGLQLEEAYGLMHCYDLDLSLQYIEKGYTVQVASVNIFHFADDYSRSSRSSDEYLKKTGGDDATYYGEVRRLFVEKWNHMLPITRGFRDEAYGHLRVGGFMEAIKNNNIHLESLRHNIGRLEKSIRDRQREIESTRRYEKKLRRASRRMLTRKAGE
jgi:GT2 family glycosyltransferase